MLEGSRYLDLLVELQRVAFLDVIEAGDLQAALHARADFPGVVLEPLEAVEGSLGADAITPPAGADRAVVRQIVSRLDRNEYKRRQAPIVLRVSEKAFGSGRRLPIVHRYHSS